MSMKSQFDFINENNTEKIQTKAWLEKEETIVTETKILDSIQGNIELVSPSDQNITLPMGQALNDKALTGKFIGNYTPKEKGMYFATITLKSQTFERQKTFSFNSKGVADTPAEPVQITEPEPEAIPEKTEEAEKEKDKGTEPEAAAEEPEEEGDLLKSVLTFVVINIIIVIIGLVIFLVIKLKKSKQTENNEEA